MGKKKHSQYTSWDVVTFCRPMSTLAICLQLLPSTKTRRFLYWEASDLHNDDTRAISELEIKTIVRMASSSWVLLWSEDSSNLIGLWLSITWDEKIKAARPKIRIQNKDCVGSTDNTRITDRVVDHATRQNGDMIIIRYPYHVTRYVYTKLGSQVRCLEVVLISR